MCVWTLTHPLMNGVPTGVFSSCDCLSKQYHFVSGLLNWTEAQKYCRAAHSDLVTITSMEDHSRFVEYVNHLGYIHSIWIGLYNDVNSWKWSLDGLSLVQTGYINWLTGQPDNLGGSQPCAAGTSKGFNDRGCDAKLPFVCYDGEQNEAAPNKYIFISEEKSWPDAQKHCRQHYTDLTSVRSEEERARVDGVSSGKTVWIGLHRDTWKWSDQNPSKFKVWLAGSPSNLRGNEDCAYYQLGGWVDNWCSEPKAFVCNSVQVQVVKIALKMDSSVNMEDPAVQEALVEQIQQKLQKEGQPVSRVSWRHQPDGKVFHQQQSKITNKQREKRSEL
ncbi:hypothetical protein ACEWY4_024841 [Coilia grayii]|uniref:C-type lectin domain-containing protein n=1 Tax=Coilia grayii TaxID=363190 RepID=A0ABD1IVW0_9TELE